MKFGRGVPVQQSEGSSPSRLTLVSLRETLNVFIFFLFFINGVHERAEMVLVIDLANNCFSPPRGKWVPVWAEMVLVIDLA